LKASKEFGRLIGRTQEKADKQQRAYRNIRRALIPDIKMVGARGFEPRTPTVSRCAGRIAIPSALPFINQFNPERLEKNTVQGIDDRGSQAKVRQNYSYSFKQRHSRIAGFCAVNTPMNSQWR
jgi:hypothetical protein